MPGCLGGPGHRPPDLQITLVEPLERRTVFLDEVVETLGLEEVEIVRGRAEALHGAAGLRRRDLAGPGSTRSAPCLVDAARGIHGVLLAMKGRSLEEEIQVAVGTLRKLGCAPPEVLELGLGTGLSTTRAVRVAHADPTRVAWRPSATQKRRNR